MIRKIYDGEATHSGGDKQEVPEPKKNELGLIEMLSSVPVRKTFEIANYIDRETSALQAEISSLKSRYEIVTADWNEEKNALQAEIELLRKSGATLRPGTSILDVIQWAVKLNVRMESGYWRMDYSSIAYTDETIIKAFQDQDHPKSEKNAGL